MSKKDNRARQSRLARRGYVVRVGSGVCGQTGCGKRVVPGREFCPKCLRNSGKGGAV